MPLAAPSTRRDRVRRLLAFLLLALCCLPLAATGATGGPAAATGTYTNPIYPQDFPDPMVLRAGPREYYAYGTTAGWQISGHEFPILRSTDLVHWRYVSDAFSAPPSWAYGDYWAPDVLLHAGTYYLYYTGLKGSHCVAVATAKAPTGPFATRAVIGCGDATGTGYIDPAIFIDAGGKAYLYISVDNPDHNISVIPLKADLLHPSGPRKQLFGLSQAWEYGQNFSTVEGPT